MIILLLLPESLSKRWGEFRKYELSEDEIQQITIGVGAVGVLNTLFVLWIIYKVLSFLFGKVNTASKGTQTGVLEKEEVKVVLEEAYEDDRPKTTIGHELQSSEFAKEFHEKSKSRSKGPKDGYTGGKVQSYRDSFNAGEKKRKGVD